MIRIRTPARRVDDFMYRYFPWLEWDYIETIEVLGGEVEVHSLQVRLNDLGKQYVAVEEYCVNGLPAPNELELLGRGELDDDLTMDEQ